MSVPANMEPPLNPSSHTGGVKPMAIAGRMVRQRERLLGMTPEERAWRAQWLKDQQLAPDEPKINPEFYKSTHNPLRRFYRAPLDKFEAWLVPRVGKYHPELPIFFRYLIGRTFLGLIGVYATVYYFKYNQSDWTRLGGWKVSTSRPVVLPDHPNWPNYETRTDREYASFGFEKSPI